MKKICCPLCYANDTAAYYHDQKRTYKLCNKCHLVFVPPRYHLSEGDEKAEYDLHRNSPRDEGYIRFLQRLANPLLARLAKPSSGLDFGCGPGPALHQLLEREGHRVALYDKFYFPNTGVLTQTFDFITATEVVEHLAAPRQVLDLLWSRIRPGGTFAIMTKRVLSADAFVGWHYKNDPTHIVFFSEETFLWLAQRWAASCDFVDKDVVFLEKREV